MYYAYIIDVKVIDSQFPSKMLCVTKMFDQTMFDKQAQTLLDQTKFDRVS